MQAFDTHLRRSLGRLNAKEEVTAKLEEVAAKGVKVRNPSFDVTPAELVTALITEKGVVRAPDREQICRLFGA